MPIGRPKVGDGGDIPIGIGNPRSAPVREDPIADVRGDAVASLGAYAASALSNRGQALLNSERGVANLDRVGEGLLASLAEDDDPDVRVSAASALALIRNKLDAVSGSETMSSRPASLAHGTLVAALDAALQRDPANQRGLMLSLGMVAHRSLAAPPGLLAVLDHPDAASRAQAVMALAGFGSGIDPALDGYSARSGRQAERAPQRG